ncbi:hypothetical protein BG011_004293 [Mortierella polycephala]|uniref:BZIP domain-containing protein n=1 Tax=Mortierella polycephala TaxID=41804 RepID=A0A9P6Q1Y5_9FUNG|nr:hypothetical protein BG011_004293 [Mortierella polycephala]
MESQPNPYSAVIATFNKQPPAKDEEEEDEDDLQHLPDDDLLLWANAQFTFDNQTQGMGSYEDELALKIAQSQQQQYQVAQQQFQQLAVQNQQFQQHTQLSHQHMHQQHPQPSQGMVPTITQQQQQHLHQPSHVPSYHPVEMQRQLQQFDAIHGYLDGSSEDPRASLSLVERSRQRNPIPPGSLLHQPQPPQQQLQFNPRVHHSAYVQQQPQQHTTSGSTTAGLIHPQALLAHQQQQFQQSPTGPSSASSSSSSISALNTRDRVSSANGLSSLPLPANPPSSSSSSTPLSHEEQLQQLESELEVYNELAEERRLQQQKERSASADMTDGDGESHGDSGNDSSSGHSTCNHITTIPNGARSRSNSTPPKDDPEYAAKLAAEDDKRRRNTAASARFRNKKRLREQILEKTAKQMTAKSEILEIRVRELEMEIKWLRGLIVEKDAARGLLMDNGKALSAVTGTVTGGRRNAGGLLPGTVSPSALTQLNIAADSANANESNSNGSNSSSNPTKPTSKRTKKP